MVLLLVAVIVAVVLLRHVGTTTTSSTAPRSHATTSVPSATTVPASTTTTSTVPAIPPSQIKLLVLNGTLAGTLAGDTSKRLAANPGYNTLAPDNTTAKVTADAIYAVTPQYIPAAQALAATVGLPASAVQTSVPPTAPIHASERTIANLILVIGPVLAAKAG